MVNADVLASRPETIERFVRAYREAYDFLYDDPAATKIFSELSGVSEKLAVKIRDNFLQRTAMQPDRVAGIEATMADAIAFKMLGAPLSKGQIDELIRIPPRN